MSTDKATLSARDVMGDWVHAHEEDKPGYEVYRPADWPLGPSRGRRRYELCQENVAVVEGIAAGDGPQRATTRWWLEDGNVIVVQEPEGSIRRLRVKSVEPDRLIVEEILDRD